MKRRLAVVMFGCTEILIGTITLLAVALSLTKGRSTKPLEVLFFVLTAAILSISLGVGILKLNQMAYKLLLYFASLIILSKILIFAKIITLSGALETAVPSALKNIISILYHGLLLFFFTRKPVREQFGETHNADFP